MFTAQKVATHLISALAHSASVASSTYPQNLTQLHEYRTARYGLPRQQGNTTVAHEIVAQLKTEKILLITHEYDEVSADFCVKVGAEQTKVVTFDDFVINTDDEDKEYSLYDTVILERPNSPSYDKLLIEDIAFLGHFKPNIKIFIIG